VRRRSGREAYGEGDGTAFRHGKARGGDDELWLVIVDAIDDHVVARESRRCDAEGRAVIREIRIFRGGGGNELGRGSCSWTARA